MVLLGEKQFTAIEQLKSVAISTNIERCGAFLRISIDAFGNLNPEQVKKAVNSAIEEYYTQPER